MMGEKRMKIVLFINIILWIVISVLFFPIFIWNILSFIVYEIIVSVILIGLYLHIKEEDMFYNNGLYLYIKTLLISILIFALAIGILYVTSRRGSKHNYCDVTINNTTTRYTEYDWHISFGYRNDRLFLQNLNGGRDLEIVADYVCVGVN